MPTVKETVEAAEVDACFYPLLEAILAKGRVSAKLGQQAEVVREVEKEVRRAGFAYLRSWKECQSAEQVLMDESILAQQSPADFPMPIRGESYFDCIRLSVQHFEDLTHTNYAAYMNQVAKLKKELKKERLILAKHDSLEYCRRLRPRHNLSRLECEILGWG